MVAVELGERCDLLVAKGRVTLVDDVLEVDGWNLRRRDVQREDFVGEVGEAEVLPALP